MISLDRRDFLKQASTAVAALMTGTAVVDKLVARDAKHDLGVLVNGEISNSEMMTHAWNEAKKKLYLEHYTSVWKGAFIPESIKFKEMFKTEGVSGNKYTRVLFEMVGKEIEGLEQVKTDKLLGASQ